MRKLFPILLLCFGVSGAFAQTDRGGVTVSNDPAKVAAVERHADELKARAAQQQAQGAAKGREHGSQVEVQNEEDERQYEFHRQEVGRSPISRPSRADGSSGTD